MSAGTTYIGYGNSLHPGCPFLKLVITCVDCGRSESLAIEEPHSRYYNGGMNGAPSVLTKLGLSFMPVPIGWHRTGFGACQLERCATCFDKYDATQEPIRKARRDAENAELEAMSVEALLESAMKPQASHEYIRRALHKLRGAPPDCDAVDPHAAVSGNPTTRD